MNDYVQYLPRHLSHRFPEGPLDQDRGPISTQMPSFFRFFLFFFNNRALLMSIHPRGSTGPYSTGHVLGTSGRRRGQSCQNSSKFLRARLQPASTFSPSHRQGKLHSQSHRSREDQGSGRPVPHQGIQVRVLLVRTYIASKEEKRSW